MTKTVGRLFLPFTPAGKASERIAIAVKKELGLGPYQAVDPFEILGKVPARLLPPEALSGMRSEARERLLDSPGSEWSAIGFGPSPVDGNELILLNPNHHEHRQRASLMEEVVHIVRKHPRVKLDFNGDGSWTRPFDQNIEDEAFNVGAACIIPYRSLFKLVNDLGAPARKVAGTFSVSRKYAMYRIKRAGLYHVYRKRQRTAS